MSAHRHNDTINNLETYFNTVINWVSVIFTDIEKSMRGIEWGKLYEKYHKNPYDPKKVSETLQRLVGDPQVRDEKGIYEFILGGEQEFKLLNIRVFDEGVKKAVYKEQADKAKKAGISNCPLCEISNNNNKDRIHKQAEMESDHVTAWSKGGSTDISNCEMLCITHNRAKGNR